jgi:hypothetical protein
MTKCHTVQALALGVLLLGGGATPVQAQFSKPAVSVVGEWKDHWGAPGTLKYNDLYRVTQTSTGKLKVQILNRKQEIFDEQLNGTVLTFSQRTDFVVQYSLTLQQDGRWMVGTATMPKKVFDVRWEKTSK